MSRSVDERIVSMQFDNRHFEQNVKTTMSTLDKLKKSLNLPGAAKGFENISASAKKCDLSPLSRGADEARRGFSALEVMAVTALANITNSAVNAGKRIVKALTLDPVTTGFSEYETKINAVQTIMSNTASKGTTMEEITKTLNDLNTYADKTIYNFAEMTKNIGLFTAAGVGLEDSAAAIKGIANLAAASGSTSNQATTAMYQLSQALASGTVKLQDWNSVQTANMGGELFQEALKKTAREHGIAVDQMIEKNGTFRESLREGWLTTEVLNDTLKKFTVEGAKEYAASMGYSAEQTAALVKEAQSMEDAATKIKTFTQLWDTLKESAQSGWAQTWEIIVGDFLEAREFLSGLYELFGGIIDHFSDARNNLLGEALNSNWEKLTAEINKAGVETDVFNKKLRAALEAGGHDADELIAKHGSFAKIFRSGAVSSDILKNALTSLNGASKTASEGLSGLSKISETLKFGSAGEEVKELQQALIDLGYDLDKYGADGKFQWETFAAVKAFQKAKGILHDGVVGPETLAALKEAAGATNELTEETIQLTGSYDDLVDGITKLSGRELLLEGLLNVTKSVIDVFKIFGSSWKNAFDPIITSDGLYTALESFHKFAEGLRFIDDATGEFNERGKQLVRVFDGVVAVLDVFASVTGGLVKMGIKALASALGMVNIDILELAACVGDALVAFRNWFEAHNVFAKAVEYTAKAIGLGIVAVREFITALLKMPAVQAVLRDVETEFGNAISSIREYLSGGLDRINTFIETVKSMDNITLDDFETLLINFKENVIDYFFDIDSLYEKFKTAFTNVRTSIETNLQTAGEKIEWVKEKVVDLAKYIKDKLPAAIAIGMGVMLIRAVGKIGNALELLSSPLELVEEIGDALRRLSSAYAFQAVTKGVMNLGIAVGILAGSVALLTLVNPDRLWSVVGALSVLIGVLAALAGAVAMIEKFGDFGKSSTAITMLAGSLLLIASSLKIMDGINLEKAENSIWILGTLAVTLGTVAGVLGKYVPTLSTGSIVFIAIAGAIRIMAGALVALDSTEFNNIGKSMTIMLGIILSLGLIAKACGKMTFGSAAGIIAAAIGLKLMVSVIEDIGELNTGRLSSNIGALIAVFGSFALLMVASRFAGANAMKAGVGILAISAAMLLIVKAMEEMGKLDGSTVSRATDSISQILIVFGAIVGLSYFAGTNAVKAGAMLLMISGAMVILAGVIHLIKDIPAVDLAKAVGAISVLEILFGGLIFISKYGDIPKGTTALLTKLTIVIGLMALIIAGLSKLKPASALSAAGSLSLVMATFAGVLAIISKNKVMTLKEIGKTALSLGALVGGVALLAQIIGKLASCNPSGVIEIAGSLSILLLAMAAAFTIVSCTPVLTAGSLAKAGVSLLALAGIVALLAQIIGALAKCEPKGALEIAASLSVLLLSMSAVCVILGGVGPVAKFAFAGIGVLMTLIGAVGLLMVGIGALVEWKPVVLDFLDNGIVALEKIGTGLGSFVGGIIGGALGGLSSGLPAIGRNLSDFMAEVQPFLDGMSAIDKSATDGVKNLAETILILTATDVLNGLTSWFTGGKSFSEFGKGIADFAPYMKQYAETLTGVDTSVVESSANAAKALANLASNLPSTGGKWQEWFGGKDLSTFGSQLTVFGQSIVDYSNAITAGGGIDSEAITASAEAAKGLADIAANLPSTGGKWQEWFGGKSLATFGSQLSLFGVSLAAYSKSITSGGGIDAKAITNSAKAAKGLADITANLPSTGGKWQEWFGGKDLSTFGKQLSSFGDSISDYSKTISGENSIDIGAINISVIAAKSLSDLASNLPSYHVFDGKSSPTEFGAEIAGFGEKLSEYCGSISGSDFTALSSSITQTNRLITVMKNMADVDSSAAGTFAQGLATLAQNGVSGFVNAFATAHTQASTAVSNFIAAAVTSISTKNTQFNAAGQLMITNLIGGIKTGGASVPDTVGNVISAAVIRIASKAPSFATSGQSLMTSLSNGIKAGSVSATTALSTMLDTVLIRVKDKARTFESTGQTLMTSLVSGMKSKDTAASSAAVAIAAAACSSIRGQYSSFRDAGKYCAQGFADGINGNVGVAKVAGTNLGRAAYNAAMAAIKAKSPSRLFMEVGSYVAQGFAIGIQDDTPLAASAASDMAASTIDVVKSSISRLADAIEGSIDTQPTIRPVLDLSNVEAGAGRLQAIFSRNQALSVNASMERAATANASDATTTATTGGTFQFTQINNSPKALSRDEIYRQTSNQFSAFERMVKA